MHYKCVNGIYMEKWHTNLKTTTHEKNIIPFADSQFNDIIRTKE